MTSTPSPDNAQALDPNEPAGEPPAPACVMSFNASDPSGAGGLSGDIATIAAMGAHALPVVTSILMRDTAEVFDHAVELYRAARRSGADDDLVHMAFDLGLREGRQLRVGEVLGVFHQAHRTGDITSSGIQT